MASFNSARDENEEEEKLQQQVLLLPPSSSSSSSSSSLDFSIAGVKPGKVLLANIKDPLFIATFLNFLFMLLYLLLDFCRGWDNAHQLAVSVGFICLGFGYVGDAVLYLQSWGEEWPTGVALWGELLNIGGSIIYACSSIMYLYQGDTRDSDAVFILEASATFVFFIDAILYFMAWYQDLPLYASASASAMTCLPGGRRRWWCITCDNGSATILKACRSLADLDLWGHLLNIAPAIIYMMSAVNGLILHFSTQDALVEGVLPPSSNEGGFNITSYSSSSSSSSVSENDSITASPSSSSFLFLSTGFFWLGKTIATTVWGAGGPLREWKPSRPASIVREMTKVYIWGDLLWTIDAAILLVGWCKDTCVLEDEDDAEDEMEEEALKNHFLVPAISTDTGAEKE